MTSVPELRAAFADDARERSQNARSAALLGARQAFVKPKQSMLVVQKPITNTRLAAKATPSIRHGSSAYTTSRQHSLPAEPSGAGKWNSRTSTALPTAQRPSIASANSRAAAAAAAASVIVTVRAPIVQRQQSGLLQSYDPASLGGRQDARMLSRPLSTVQPEGARSVQTGRKSSDPSTLPRSRPETRTSQAHTSTLVVPERSKSKSPSPSGIAAALAAARCAPSIQPATQYVDLLPTSGTISHVKKWLQSLEGLSPEQGSPLRQGRGPWRPTIVNMPEVPPNLAHLSNLDHEDSVDNNKSTETYFVAAEAPVTPGYTPVTTPSDVQIPSFQIHSPKVAYSRSIVNTIEEASLDGITTSNFVIQRKPVPTPGKWPDEPPFGATSLNNHERDSIVTSRAGYNSQPVHRTSTQASGVPCARQQSSSPVQRNGLHSIPRQDYFNGISGAASVSHFVATTTPDLEPMSISLTRPTYPRMDSQSTAERSPRSRMPSHGSTADLSFYTQQPTMMVMSPLPVPTSNPYARRSYASTNLSLPQLPRPLSSDITGNSLPNRTALLASNVASSRAPSPSKTLPLHSSRRQSEKSSNPLNYFRSRSHTRTPSPTKKLRHTLRKERSPKDDDEPKAHRRKKLIRKHPHKHHEGDRKRWRDTITERERRRYEGLWAANRGVHVHGEPVDSRSGGTTYNPAQAQKVCSLVVRDLWSRSRLPANVLEEIWDLVDTLHDGTLRKEGFVVGTWLIDQRLKGRKLPVKVGQSVWDSVWLVAGVKRRP